MLWLQSELRELQAKIRSVSKMLGSMLDLAKKVQEVRCVDSEERCRRGMDVVARQIRRVGMTQGGEGGRAYGKMSSQNKR